MACKCEIRPCQKTPGGKIFTSRKQNKLRNSDNLRTFLIDSALQKHTLGHHKKQAFFYFTSSLKGTVRDVCLFIGKFLS